MRRVGVDVGGTFTDLASIAPDGTLHVTKVVSTPDDPARALFRAVDAAGGAVDVLVHGTTVATNALLERRGARVVLVTTAGFEDILWLRRQDRAALYDLARDHPQPLVARADVIGAAERMGPAGPLLALTDAAVTRVLEAARGRRPEAVAVCCLFSFRHPAHERRLAAALKAAFPGVPVAASVDVLPVFREYERSSTTVAEAYLRPKISAYVARTEDEAARRKIGAFRVMTSGGGTLPPAVAAERAAALALSGPAGGVVGARLVGEVVGATDLLTLDMGGTSADASLVQKGGVVTEGGGIVGGVPLALPAVLIETVSAGGGSVAWVDAGGALKVGPRSAGAVPGPACYGRGGTEPTVTDACVVLGWLDPARPLADDVRLDRALAERALEPLARATRRDITAVAAGVVEVAAAVMARALKRVSVARGVDPRRFALLPFGGAGPLFGCALAESLGMRTVVVPPHPGALSALGLAAAPERLEFTAAVHRPLAQLGRAELEALFAPLVARVAAALPGAATERLAECRFAGQGYEIAVPVIDADPGVLEQVFLAAHRVRHGHAERIAPVEVVNVRVVGQRAAPLPDFRRPETGPAPVADRRQVGVRGRRMTADVWPLDTLPAGATVVGPAVLAGGDATALVEPGWRGTVHVSGAVILERT